MVKGKPLKTEYKSNKSRFKGVHYRKDRKRPWYVRIVRNNKEVYLGSYSTPEAAGCAYNRYLLEVEHTNVGLNEELLDRSNRDIFELINRVSLAASKYRMGSKNYKRIWGEPSRKKKKKKKTKEKPAPHSVLPSISRKALVGELENLKVNEIAKKYSLSSQKIIEYKKVYKLDCLPNYHWNLLRKGLSRDETYKAFIIDNKSFKQISIEYNVSDYLAHKAVEYYNIDFKDKYNYHSKTCPVCEKVYLPDVHAKGQRACSETCGDVLRSRDHCKRQSDKKVYTCNNCNKTYTGKEKYSFRYCSQKCKVEYLLNKKVDSKTKLFSRVYFYQCISTGERFTSKTPITEGNTFKTKEIKNKYIREQRIRKCIECGAPKRVGEFEIVKAGGNYYCSKNCLDIYLLKSNEQRKQRMRKWCQDNKDRLKLSHSKYHAKIRQETLEREGRCTSKEKRLRSSIRKKLNRDQTPKSAEITKRMNLFGQNVCCWCSKICDPSDTSDCTIEHLIPLSKGGTNDLINLFRSCGFCNFSKSNRSWKEWFKSQTFYSKEREEQIEYYSKNIK